MRHVWDFAHCKTSLLVSTLSTCSKCRGFLSILPLQLKGYKIKKKITPQLIKDAYELSKKAYPNNLIAQTLQISETALYGNVELVKTIKRGKAEAKQKIIDTLLERTISDQSPTALIFLTKQLKIFDTYFKTSKPKSAKDAALRISNIYESVARNELDQEKADKLVHYLEKYIKAYEVSELEERLNILEERINEN